MSQAGTKPNRGRIFTLYLIFNFLSVIHHFATGADELRQISPFNQVPDTFFLLHNIINVLILITVVGLWFMRKYAFWASVAVYFFGLAMNIFYLGIGNVIIYGIAGGIILTLIYLHPYKRMI